MSYITQMTSMGVIATNRFSENSTRLTGQTQQKARTTPIESAACHDEQLTLAQSQSLLKLNEALEYQAMQFERYKFLTEEKFTTISKDLLDVSMQLKEARAIIDSYKDKLDIQKGRDALIKYQQGDKPPLDRPIDRNGVAPKDVRIDTIFNCSGKRF